MSMPISGYRQIWLSNVSQNTRFVPANCLCGETDTLKKWKSVCVTILSA